jgi:hypothetical protein
LAAENWKERRPKEELALRVTSEIYLLERVLRVGAAMVTSDYKKVSIPKEHELQAISTLS